MKSYFPLTRACFNFDSASIVHETVGKKANTCGTSSYNILTGNFNHGKFNSCFSASIGISETCAECYAATSKYGANNCKASCILGWCKSGCLSCTKPTQETLAMCTGFASGTAQPCEELKVSGGACSSDEQSALSDPQTVGGSENETNVCQDCVASSVTFPACLISFALYVQ